VPASDNPPPGGAGLLGSLRRLLDTVLELGQVRLELLGTEIEDQKRRALAALVWAGAGLVLLGAGLVVLAAGVLAYFWDGARWIAWAALLAVYFGAAALALYRARIRLRATEGAFAASAAELARDRQALSGADERPGAPG
jgi:uncharacterized membrane protein YqjE